MCEREWSVSAFDPSLKMTQLTYKLTNKQRIKAALPGAYTFFFCFFCSNWEQLTEQIAAGKTTLACSLNPVSTVWHQLFPQRLKLFSCLHLSPFLFVCETQLNDHLSINSRINPAQLQLNNPRKTVVTNRVPLFWDSKGPIVASDLFHLKSRRDML